MSVDTAPAYLSNQDRPIIEASLQAQALPTAKSVTGIELEGYIEPRSRKPTERGKSFNIKLKLANRRSAYLILKRQIEKISALRDVAEPDAEVLEKEKHRLDEYKDIFNQAHQAYDELLETEDHRVLSYQWFDVRDREYMECRLRVCERIQALERKSYRTQSGASHTSVKSKTSKASSSSKHLSLALVDAVTKAAKLQAEMDFLEREKEIKRFQLEKELAIANAQEVAIKGFLAKENKLPGDKEGKGVKQELKPEIGAESIRQEMSFPVNPYAPPFVPTNFPAAFPPEPLRAEPVITQTGRSHDISIALQEIVSLQAKQTELSSLIINQQKTSHLPVKEPPVFSGDAFEFPAFTTTFDTIIAANVPSDRDRLYFLDKYTKGKANDVVKGFLAMNSDSAYQEARKLLDHRFGNPVYVAEAYKSSLRNWPQISDGDSTGIQEFSDFLVRCEEAMKTMKSMGDLDSTQTLLHISSKLPSYSGIKWCRNAHVAQAKDKRIVTFSDFVRFVREEAELANDPVFSPDALKRERKKTATGTEPRWGRSHRQSNKVTNKASSSSFAISATRDPGVTSHANSPGSQSNSPCPVCDGQHNLAKCNKFLKASPEERSDVIRSKGLCFRCFKKGHVSFRCSSAVSCEECGKRHHTLLHGAKPKNRSKDNQSSPKSQSDRQGVSNEEKPSESSLFTGSASSNATSVAHNSVGDPVSMTNCRIVQVILFHKDNPSKQVKVYALLDDASDTTFLTTKVQNDLGIEGAQTSLDLSTMLGREELPVQRVNGLIAQRLDRRAEVELPKAYARPSIPSRRDQIPTPETTDKWPHLTKIKSKIPPYDESIEIGLLIGCNCPKAIRPKEVISGKSEEPYAVRTLLGWCIVGPVAMSNSTLEDHAQNSTCHRIVAREIVKGSCDSQLSFVLNEKTKEVINPSSIRQMFELDFAERKSASPHGLSKEDRRFLGIAEQGIHKCENGHYELPLPLRDDCEMPNNRESALRRLNQLKRRLESKNSQKYRDDYVAFMDTVIKNGYAERVEEHECSKNTLKSETKRRIWYIPHHGVYHPKKPNKIRVVFDCAAEYMNESLNKHLLQGPDLTNNLTGVLCRFRQEQVAFTCDIEGMFHQVNVNEEHRDLLRFLWWEGGDTHKKPQEYRMTVHLFGATSSPGCANFALKSTANDHESEFGAIAANFLRNDFYVDDGLKSVSSASEAVKLVEDSKQMCQRGGFNLHKFVSNDKEVLKSIPESDRAEGVKELDLDLDSLPLERTLGVQWCVESDSFQFSIVLQDKPRTRRGILSTVSSIFDPLGFVAPLLLEGKSILQELCRHDLGWDDPISEDVKIRWAKWRAELMRLERISIPRCYKPPEFGSVVCAELHHFSDASVKGYGQCSYLRLIDENQRIHCSFVMGKSRVAPLKPVTIPRLELTAAVCSVKVSQQLRRELEYRIDKEVFWTDSKVVLGYINNESRRFHVYVANRVQDIQDHTSVKQWRYIESKRNPADDASRGIKAQELSDSRWITGPSFLWEKESQWPVSSADNQASHRLEENDPDVRKSVTMATSITLPEQKVTEMPTLADRVQYFSDWYRAKRAVALCLRYIKHLKDRVHKKQRAQEKELTVSDLESAERAIIRAVQCSPFKDEIATLKKIQLANIDPESRDFVLQRKVNMKTHSTLYKLDPFLDADGILRVGGRLRRASLSDDVKFPVILPRNSHVTMLIVKHFHERTSHQGKGMTLNEIRSNGFWIIGSSPAVTSVISSCVKCQKLRGTVQEQRMADLPEDRLECTPPFSYCAVDYFGPFIVKEGRKELKRYGVLFTCMASRAIHLETANSLETDSFINALRRFISRRGPIRQLRSDQGTNFVGARRELTQALTEMDQDKIKGKLLEDNCDWFSFKMNVPAASHMGGVWERQIRTVRNVLSSLLRDNAPQLDDESLRTLMCEVEAIVNSRPLTAVQLGDPDSPRPLTPNHLLTMKSKVVLAPPGAFQSADMYCRKRWRRVQHLANEFWTRWRKEFLLHLQQRQKWTRPRKNLCIGDVVIIKDENLSRSAWQLARVSEIYPSEDGCVRKVQVALADSCLDNKGKRTSPVRYLERPVQKLVLLMSSQV